MASLVFFFKTNSDIYRSSYADNYEIVNDIKTFYAFLYITTYFYISNSLIFKMTCSVCSIGLIL